MTQQPSSMMGDANDAKGPVAVITAGGTGGHVMPGLAIANELRRRGWRVTWIGNPTGMEAALTAEHGIAMLPVNFSGLRGKGLLTKLLLPLNLLRGFWQSIVALRRVRPAVVVGMGGYVTFPVGMMASLLNIPLLVHEQNSIAGLANRVLTGVADRVLQAFDGALKGAAVVGNPLRIELMLDDDPFARVSERSGQLNVLVVGGSLGAKALNETVPAALALMSPDKRPVVTHQSGHAHLHELQQAYDGVQVQAHVVDFIQDIAGGYQWADLVVCRAGAMTVSELAAVGVASILVPYPYAVDDHQHTNAAYLAGAGAAIRIPQNEFSAQWLADQLTQLDRPGLAQMAMAARTQARPRATLDVADHCEQIAKKVGVLA